MADEIDSSIEVVKDVCGGVTTERARELLEAGGTVQRAIDIHLTSSVLRNSKNEQLKDSPKCKDSTPLKRKPQSSTTSRSPQKQSKLSAFFGQDGNAKKTNPDVMKIQTSHNTIASEHKINRNHKENDDDSVEPQAKRTPLSTGSPKRFKGDKAPVSSTDKSQDPRLHYIVLAEAFSDMVATTKRLAKIDALKKVLHNVIEAVGGIENNQDPDDYSRNNDGETLFQVLQLILPGGSIKLQVSGSLVSKAVRTVTGASSTRLREAYRETGDLGDAAERFVRNQTLLIQPEPLSINEVYALLCKIASQEGKNSQSQRHELMVKLLRSCRQKEMRFLVRTLLGNMRLGANIKTVIVALASAVVAATNGNKNEGSLEKTKVLQEKTAKAIQQTFDICPRLDRISLALLCGGIPHMERTCLLEVGTPVNPMLANPARSFDEVSKLMTTADGTREAVAEYKYDGVRCQAHFDGRSVRLFSRNMLENTEQYPDVVEALLGARMDTVESFILDGEIVAVEGSEEQGGMRLLPFQDLSTRSGALPGSSSNPVCVRLYAFDLMLLNGQSLIGEPLWKRQATVHQHFVESRGFSFASSLILHSFDEATISSFLEQAVMQGAEGLMVKLTGKMDTASNSATTPNNNDKLTCQYESGTRSQTWLKVKRDYVAGFADTIDVVPIGAWHGHGRKAQKGFLSPVLLAVYDEEEEVFRSISRCMSFSDAMYEAMREFYFRGTPYPVGVGLEKSKTAGDATAGLAIVDEEAGDSDEGLGEAVASFKSEQDMSLEKDQVEGVNCYSERRPALIDTNEKPPIWFKPMEVFEVAFADLSLSRAHRAAAGMIDSDPSRGVALRFPRFIRRRPDKRVEQATSSVQIAQLFAKQAKQGRKAANR